MESTLTRAAGPVTGEAVRLLRLRKQFGSVLAVNHIDLTIAPGETVALLGPNGAGKTTTIEMLLGLQRPTTGEVRVFGARPERAVAAGKVGAMLQSGGMVDRLTIREMLTMVAGMYGDPLPVSAVLEQAGLTEIADRRVEKLSGGQRQRARFALAVVGDPQLLFLDEPTVAMDVETRRAFWASLRTSTDRGRTVLFATHYLEEADAVADRIVVMHRGAIVADGPATAIKAAAGSRVVRCTLDRPERDMLLTLPGVKEAEVRGHDVTLRCADSDAATRALLTACPDARDLEVTGAGIEDAFLALTGDSDA